MRRFRPRNAPTRKTARAGRALRRGGPRVLSIVAALFVGSAVARLSATLADESHGAWHAFSAWAQSGASGEDPAEPEEAGSQSDPDALIAALVARDKALLQREQEVERRERALEIAEQELRAGLEAFQQAEAALRETIALADGAAQADLDRLTRMYETMKPKDAAALFETMDPTFAAGFLGQMNPAAAAEILSGLPPELAYRVSLVLAGRNMRAQEQ